jgi:hypothetical protein
MHAKAAAAGPHAHHHHAAAHSPPRVLVLSWHHGLVAALEGQYAAFGPTCRLAKRWLGTQLLGSQLGCEAVELLVGAAFCGPALAPPPASRVTGEALDLSQACPFFWGGGKWLHAACSHMLQWAMCLPVTTHPAPVLPASWDLHLQAFCASCSCWPATPGCAPPC